jgi:hypothetical protein
LLPLKAVRRATDVRNPSHSDQLQESHMGRSILLWLLGVPIPIIILLALFWR